MKDLKSVCTSENWNPHRRIPAAAVCEICGGISAMTLYRWLGRSDLQFPRPIYVGRRRYWKEAEVVAWLDAREQGKAQ